MDDYIAGISAAAEHPVLKRILDLWNDKRAGRALPAREDFDPIEMPYALGYLSLFDVEEAPRRFWCRLDGTRQVELFGIDCTGRYLDACFSADYAALAHASFSAVVDQARPLYHLRQVPYGGRLIRYEVAMLPLSRGCERVDMLMVALAPHWD